VRRIVWIIALLAACDEREVVSALAERAVGWLAAVPSRAAASTCDRAKLTADGRDAFSRGEYQVALAQFEKAMRCRPTRDDALARGLVLAACYARDEARAKRYFDQLATRDKPQLAALCTNLLHPCVYSTFETRDRP
jgi:Flp pilus assembly protein TadD